MSDLDIRLMSEESIDDWLAFFDGPAFADNPDWDDCYCMHYLYEGGQVDDFPAEENRRRALDGFRTGAATGMLAFLAGQPVGWVRFGAKTSFPLYRDRRAVESDDNDQIGSIVCFVIDHRHRRRGVADALLRAACDALQRDGFAVAEAYPLRDPENDAEAYHGPVGLYLGRGFRPVAEFGRVTVVQRPLS